MDDDDDDDGDGVSHPRWHGGAFFFFWVAGCAFFNVTYFLLFSCRPGLACARTVCCPARWGGY